MIRCPHCGRPDPETFDPYIEPLPWVVRFKSPVEPDADRFHCYRCDKEFTRLESRTKFPSCPK